MAKLQTPILSFGASGQINKTLVAYTVHGQSIVRTYVIPRNPRTAAQTTQRSKIKYAVTFWQRSIPVAGVRTAWERHLERDFEPMSGYNKCTQQVCDELTSTPEPWFCSGWEGWILGTQNWRAAFAPVVSPAAPPEGGWFELFSGTSLSGMRFDGTYALGPTGHIYGITSYGLGTRALFQFRKGTWRSGIIRWTVGTAAPDP